MTYRTIITEELTFRMKENPNYSLRAFARDLELSPSQLSEVINQKLGLSSKKAIEVAKRLGLSAKECLLFKAMVEAEHGRSKQIMENAKKFLSENTFGDNFKGLSLDGFRLISDWHHFAILSCMELDAFDGTLFFLSNRLKLDMPTVEECIKRLLKMDIIDLKDGKFVPANCMLTTTHDIASSALKKFHKQHLANSLKALEEVPVELRDITTMTMAIDVDKLKEAKELIKDFRRQLCKFLESGKKDQVYNLNIQLIPLTQVEE